MRLEVLVAPLHPPVPFGQDARRVPLVHECLGADDKLLRGPHPHVVRQVIRHKALALLCHGRQRDREHPLGQAFAALKSRSQARPHLRRTRRRHAHRDGGDPREFHLLLDTAPSAHRVQAEGLVDGQHEHALRALQTVVKESGLLRLEVGVEFERGVVVVVVGRPLLPLAPQELALRLALLARVEADRVVGGDSVEVHGLHGDLDRGALLLVEVQHDLSLLERIASLSPAPPQLDIDIVQCLLIRVRVLGLGLGLGFRIRWLLGTGLGLGLATTQPRSDYAIMEVHEA